MTIKILKKSYIIFLYISVIAIPSLWGSGPGSTAFDFLNLPVGAREIGMGVGTAVSHGPNAYWWNPAGLGYVERYSVSAMHNQYFQDVNQQRIGFAFPMENMAAGGINISILSVEQIEGYDWYGEPSGTLSARDYYISYTQAQRITRYLSGGLTLKGIFEQLHEDSVFAVGLDGGVIVEPVEGLWLSGGVKNAGVSGRLVEEVPSMPVSFFTGLGLRLNKFTLIAADVIYINDQLRYGGGVEFDLWQSLYFRGGWNSRSDIDETFRFGGGVRWGDLELDYALAPFGELGISHRVDLNFKFGEPVLIEQMYRKGKKFFKDEQYRKAWLEFNKVYSLDSNYKRIRNWMERTKNKRTEFDN